MRLKKIYSLLLFMCGVFILGFSQAKAADYHFEHVIYLTEDPYGFLDEYKAGEATPVTDGMVEPEDILAVGIHVTTTNGVADKFEIHTIWDEEVLSPWEDSAGWTLGAMDNTHKSAGGIFPDNARANGTYWKPQTSIEEIAYYDVAGTPIVSMLIGDYDTATTKWTEDGVIYWIFFTVNEVDPFTEFEFSFEATKGAISATTTYADVTNAATELQIYGEVSNDNSLSNLTVSKDSTNYVVNPVEGVTNTYRVYVPNGITDVVLNATATDSSAIVSSDGENSTKTLTQVGDNTYTFTVTAGDGTLATYTVYIYQLNNVSTLSSLSLTNTDIALSFDAGTETYNLSVPYQTTATNVNATASTGATIKSGTGAFPLTNYGATANTHTVRVEAENCAYDTTAVPGNTCSFTEYKINITRANPSTDATLKSLTANGTAVALVSGTYTYNLADVKGDVTDIPVTYETNDENATAVLANNTGLVLGNNAITITVTAEDGTTTQTYTLNVKKLSNDTTLQSLSVTGDSNGVLSPGFANGTYTYTYTYNEGISKLTVNATATDTNATVTGAREYDLSTETKADVTVKAEDGTEKTYTITFQRKQSSDATLKTLTVKNGTDIYGVTLVTGQYSYSVTIPHEQTSVTIEAEANSTNIQSLAGEGTFTISDFTPIVKTITVTAEDGTEQPYTLTINRALSDNTYLSEIKIDGTLITGFDKTLETYTLPDVKGDVASLALTYKTENAYAVVTLQGENLTVGNNQVKLIVTPQDTTKPTRTYTINVKKLSNDITLQSLSVTGDPNGVLSPGFANGTYTYTYTYNEGISKLTVNATATDPNATVTGAREYDLSTETKAEVTVKAEDETEKTYTITFQRKQSSDVTLKTLTVKNGTDVYGVTLVAGQYNYSVTIPHEITSVTIEAEANSTNVISIAGTGTFTIADFAPEVKNITVTAEDSSEQLYTVTINRALSDNTYLSEIKIDGTLITGFDKTIETYTLPDVKGDVASLALTYKTENAYAIVTLQNENLTVGNNQVKLIVTPQDTTKPTRTYTLNVKKLSNDATLQSLSVTGDPTGVLSPGFSSSTDTYTYTYDETVSKLTVNATATDTNATVTGAREYDLSTETKAEITVKAEDETEKTYTITFQRKQSSDATLKTLTVKNGTDVYGVTLAAGQYSYSVTIPHEKTNVTIEAEANSANIKSITGIGAFDVLDFTPHITTVTVTAEDGTEQPYTLTINRELSDNTYLSEIKIDGTLITGFNKTIETYTLPDVKGDVTSLALTYKTENAYAVVTLQNENLTVGNNQVKLIVTPQDTTKPTRTYTLNVKKLSNDASLNNLSITSSPQGDLTKENDTTYTYEYERGTTGIVISATATDTNATVTGDGSYDLASGSSTKVTVTAEDGTKVEYTINFVQKLNNDSTLASLAVKTSSKTYDFVDKTFNPATTDYTVIVENNVDKVTIEAACKADQACTSITGTGEVTLNPGSNTKVVTVTAEDGTSTTDYTLTIIREINTEAALAALNIDGSLIAGFNASKTEYSISVSSDVEDIEIEAIPVSGATVSGDTGTQSLTPGPNTFTITVKSQDGKATIDYIVNVRRLLGNADITNLVANSTPNSTVTSVDATTYRVDIPDEVTLVTLVPTVSSGATVKNPSTLTDIDVKSVSSITITVEAEDTNITKTYTVNFNILPSTNNYLKELTVNTGTLTPPFNKETTSYTVNVGSNVANITINATAEHSEAVVTGHTGNQPLNPGENTFTITVSAEDPSTTDRVYTVVVNRAKKDIKTLSDLTIDGTTISDFASTKTSYTLSLPYGTTSIDLNAIPTDHPDATIDPASLGTKTVSDGTILTFEVVAQDSTTQTYTITVDILPNTSTAITGLTVFGQTPTFNSTTNTYEVTVDSTTNSIGSSNISLTLPDGATIVYDADKPLTTGANSYQFTVTAEDGTTTKPYTIIINKSASTDATLKSLSVTDYPFEETFASATIDYNIGDVLDTVTSLTVNAEANHAGATIKYQVNSNPITTNNELSIPNTLGNATIKVIVTAEDGTTTKTYTINYTLVTSGLSDIISDIHTITTDYITSANPNDTVDQFKAEFENVLTELKLYDKDGITSYTGSTLKTGLILKLERNGEVLDSKYIVVKGDTTGDGKIDLFDAVRVLNDYLTRTPLTGPYKEAAYLTNDNAIDLFDAVRILNHYLERNSIH